MDDIIEFILEVVLEAIGQNVRFSRPKKKKRKINIKL